MSVPLPPGAGIENIDPEQIKTVSILLSCILQSNHNLLSVQGIFNIIQ